MSVYLQPIVLNLSQIDGFDSEHDDEPEHDHDPGRVSESNSDPNSSSGGRLPSPAFEKVSSNLNQLNTNTSTNSGDLKRKRSNPASST